MRRSIRPFLLVAAATAVSSCDRGSSAAADRAVADDTATAIATRSPYGATGGDIVRVTPVEIEVIDLPEGWNGMRIAALSDFHLGMWPDNVNVARAAMERAVAERPDLIVLLGDYVGRGGDFTALDRVLEPAKGRPVYAVMGNEDMAENTEGEPDSMAILTRQALERNGVRVLMNQRVAFGRNGDTAYIAGIDPYTARRPDWRRAETYGGIPGGGRTPVMLAHMPVSAATLPTDKYPSMISGHTFCGGLEVPGTPRLSWVNTELFPQETGVASNRIYRIRGSTLFITCGVGFSFVPVRFGAPPEVAMITLRPVGGAVKRDTAAAPSTVNVDSLIQQFTPEADTTRRDTVPGEEEA